MTPIGQKIFAIYAAVVVFILMIKSFKDIDKEGGKGWLVAVLTPVLIVLLNLI